jgi:hypothetical protein
MSTQPQEMKAGRRTQRRAPGWVALSVLGLAAAAIIIPSCVQGGLGPDQRTTVTSRSPVAGTTGVSRTAVITVEFNGAILASTVTPSTLTLSDPNGVVASTVTFQSCKNIATLIPMAPLAPGTIHRVDLTTGIADPNGRSIAADSFSFTTGTSADVTRPIFGGATSVTSPDVPTTTVPGSPTTIIPGTPVTTIPPTTIATGPGTSVTIPGSSFTTPVTGATIPGAGTTPTTGVTTTVPGSTAPLTGITSGGTTVTTPFGTGVSGATIVSAVATFSATVSWSPGSDDQDPASALVYDVFISTMSGCYNFGAPDFTSAPGATSATLTNLQLGRSHFFVVRARDTAGNQDLNANEVALLSALTPNVSFLRDVWPIVQVHCQTCHTQGPGAKQVPDMILSSAAATYASWVNIAATCPDLPPGTIRVRPTNSLASFLWQKISMDVPPCGARMPMNAPPLSTLEQQTIQSWIDLGAANN